MPTRTPCSTRAFVDHHVLVIRDQHYTPEQFKVAAQVFGELQPHDKKQHHVPGHPDVYYVSNDEVVNGKRTCRGDLPHRPLQPPAPPKATTLYAVSLPSQGGDTQFVDVHGPTTSCRRRRKRPTGILPRGPRLSKVQPALARHDDAVSPRDVPPPRATARASPSGEPATGALSQPRPDGGDRGHGGPATRSRSSTNSTHATQPQYKYATSGCPATGRPGTTAASCTRRTRTTTRPSSAISTASSLKGETPV